MIGRRFGVGALTADIVTEIATAAICNYPIRRAQEIPPPPPPGINSEGATGLAGILFGQDSKSGWGFAQLCGWHCIHARDSRGQGIEGLPDWICIRETVIYVELKRQRDELRPAQLDTAARLIAAGAYYYLVRPGDFTEFCTVLVHGPQRERGDRWRANRSTLSRI